jgi:hypothetical protein
MGLFFGIGNDNMFRRIGRRTVRRAGVQSTCGCHCTFVFWNRADGAIPIIIIHLLTTIAGGKWARFFLSPLYCSLGFLRCSRAACGCCVCGDILPNHHNVELHDWPDTRHARVEWSLGILCSTMESSVSLLHLHVNECSSLEKR